MDIPRPLLLRGLQHGQGHEPQDPPYANSSVKETQLLDPISLGMTLPLTLTLALLALPPCLVSRRGVLDVDDAMGEGHPSQTVLASRLPAAPARQSPKGNTEAENKDRKRRGCQTRGMAEFDGHGTPCQNQPGTFKPSPQPSGPRRAQT